MEKTVIILRQETKELLKKRGRKGDSYDDIIQQLLSSCKCEAIDDQP